MNSFLQPKKPETAKSNPLKFRVLQRSTFCDFLFAFYVLFFTFCGCAGYQVGTNKLYNQEIKTVYVPMFENNTYRRNLGERLTEAVVRKIEQRTPYKVVHRKTADSILTGKLSNERQTVTLTDDYAGTRQKKVEFAVLVQWKDRRGNTLRTMSPIVWNNADADITTGSDMVAEMGHSYATASQDAIEKTADQIVDMMQLSW
ncbi:MAG: LPS assembly lipoprotein LptE [Planctomycetaceae bacterium]|jgi:hypothetical protein|nr:LPS assembly lipoprotein LptE [Planctomycetaceae bacterium]